MVKSAGGRNGRLALPCIEIGNCFGTSNDSYTHRPLSNTVRLPSSATQTAGTVAENQISPRERSCGGAVSFVLVSVFQLSSLTPY